MITSGDLTNGNLFVKPIKVNKTNGWWCKKCECYHPFDIYTKPTSTVIGFKLQGG